MSHFTVLVIGENPVEQLEPFDENLQNVWKDETKEYRDLYETGTSKEFYCASHSSWGYEITKELFDFITTNKPGVVKQYKVERQPLSYLENNKKYRGYYTIDGGRRCDGDAWFEVVSVDVTSHPDSHICFEGLITIRVINPPAELYIKDKYPDYDTYLKDYHGVDDPTLQGYWYNPNAKWDWYQLGGRWSGLIKLKNNTDGVIGEPSLVAKNIPGIDQAKKGDISNLTTIYPFAILKNGEWYEKGEMGWWGMVSNENIEWEKEVTKLLTDLPDDTLISIYDCHI